MEKLEAIVRVFNNYATNIDIEYFSIDIGRVKDIWKLYNPPHKKPAFSIVFSDHLPVYRHWTPSFPPTFGNFDAKINKTIAKQIEEMLVGEKNVEEVRVDSIEQIGDKLNISVSAIVPAAIENINIDFPPFDFGNLIGKA